MIVVNARLAAKPEWRDELVNIVKGMLDTTRAEKGCGTYLFYEDAEDLNTFGFVEEWESQAALDDHWRTTHFTKLFEALPELIAEPPELKVYEVANEKGMEAIEAART